MTTASSPNHHDVIVIGAGFNGLVAAKSYLQLKPSVDILIIDDRPSVGGVWSKERLYPGLYYEMPAALLNFTDFDICKELGVEMWEDVSGPQLNSFLVQYAQKHELLSRCKMSTEAVSVTKTTTGWVVQHRPSTKPEVGLQSLSCKKLIVATGLCSRSTIPDYDLTEFDGSSFHVMDMAKRYPELLADGVDTVTVVGGHKSALEAVGTCAQSGKRVEWLINENGSGPAWMLPSRNPDGSHFAKMASRRGPAFLAPSVYHSSRWLDRFLHSGRWRVGTWLLNVIWKKFTERVQRDIFTKSENGRKLKPDPDTFYWYVPGGTMLHDRDFETIRLVDEGKLIQVHRAHMVSASGNNIALSTGQSVRSDAIVFATGWYISSSLLFEPPLANELGLPVHPAAISEEENEYWQTLDQTALKRMDAAYPMLKDPPSNVRVKKFDQEPFRLFRSLVPPKLAARGDRSIVFLGVFANAHSHYTAEIGSLWCIAYLENLFPASTNALLGDKNEMDKDIAHVEAYRVRRFCNAFLHRLNAQEASEFDDIMVQDLGLRTDRKRMKIAGGWRAWFGLKAWLAEWFGDYLASDYEGLVEEFLESHHRHEGYSEISDKIPNPQASKKKL